MEEVKILDLEKNYLENKLEDFVKTLTFDQLNKLYYLIVADDIVGIRKDIYEILLEEIDLREESKINFKEEYNRLVLAYLNNNLIDTLKMYSEFQLESIRALLICNDLFDFRLVLYLSINEELEYRNNNKLASKKVYMKK